MKNIFPILEKEKFWLWFLLVGGFLLRIFYIFDFTSPEKYLWSDAGEYDQRALMMAKGEHIDFSTYWPPFFHIILSLIYRPLAWLKLENWRIEIDIFIFAILYVAAFWCIYQICKKLFSVRISLFILSTLIVWYPLIFFNSLVMSENLFFFLVFWGLYILICRQNTILNGALLGIIWGSAFLTRPIFALVIPFFILWGIFYKINWKMLASFFVSFLFVATSMMAFNFYYTNGSEKSFSSNGGVGVAALWCDAKSIRYDKDNYYFIIGWPGNSDYPEDKKIETDVPFDNQAYYYKMGLDCFLKNPIRLIENFHSVWKLFDSCLFPAISSIPGWKNFRKIFKILNGFLFICSAATIAGFATNRIKIRKDIKKYFYLMALIITSLIITLYIQNPGEERYLIPYAPLLIILSIPLFLHIANLISKKWSKKS